MQEVILFYNGLGIPTRQILDSRGAIPSKTVAKVLQEIGFGSLPSSTETNPRDQVKSISTTIEADSYPIRQKKGSYEPQFSEAYWWKLSINNSIPRKEKDPGSFTLPCFNNNVCFDNALVRSQH
ncbi:hypothetical protein Tco_1504635 [Tanacetum coccineum]